MSTSFQSSTAVLVALAGLAVLASSSSSQAATYMEIDFSGVNVLGSSHKDTFSGTVIYDLAAAPLGGDVTKMPIVSASLTNDVVNAFNGSPIGSSTTTYSSPTTYALLQTESQNPSAGANMSFEFDAVPFVGEMILRIGRPLSDPLGVLPQDPTKIGGYAINFTSYGQLDTNISHNAFLFTPQPSNPPVDGVPEPAAWVLMIGGFGLAGAGLRRLTAVAAP